MRTSIRAACLALATLAGGCGQASEPAPAKIVHESPFALECRDSVEGFYDRPASLPTFDASRRGDVVRCGHARDVSAAEIDAWLARARFAGVQATTSVRVYRIAFRTERLSGREGISGALVFVPNKPRSGPRPVIVTAHGTVGAGAACAPSRSGLLVDERTGATAAHGMSLSLAALGHTVIAPDYAGYGFGGDVQWLLAEDEAHSVLDSTRAVRKLLPSLDKRVFLVGHSQGGHAVLSAHAHARAYGLSGELSGVAAMAPPWWVGKTYGAIVSPLAGLNTTKDAAAIAYALLYFHGHARAYDGSAASPFREGKRAAIDALLDTACTQQVFSGLASLGATPGELFDPDFVSSVGMCGVADACDSGPAAKWIERFRADRPSVDPSGAPIVLWHGGRDDGVAVERAQCGVDKLARDVQGIASPTTITACGDPEATHDGVVERHMAWLDRWIDARVTGAAAPACGAFAALGGASAPVCATPPTNND